MVLLKVSDHYNNMYSYQSTYKHIIWLQTSTQVSLIPRPCAFVPCSMKFTQVLGTRLHTCTYFVAAVTYCMVSTVTESFYVPRLPVPPSAAESSHRLFFALWTGSRAGQCTCLLVEWVWVDQCAGECPTQRRSDSDCHTCWKHSGSPEGDDKPLISLGCGL